MSKHKTARGREFNMQAFADSRGDVRAVGNVNRNARGDLIGQDGKIIATNEQINQHVYSQSSTTSKQVKLNPMEQEVSRKEVVGADGVARVEITYADGSVEVQKLDAPPSVNIEFDPPIIPEKNI
jgi:hypothetical protein